MNQQRAVDGDHRGSAVLEVRDLHAGYGGMEILKGVNIRVCEGDVVAIIGPNGAGKSTVLKSILGFTTIASGQVLVDGEEVTGLRADKVVRRGVAYVPQGRIVFADMTVDENLEMGAYTVDGKAAVAEELAKVRDLFPLLSERRKQRAGTLSGGQQQMLAIGRALMSRPTVVILDEPSLGLAPKLVDDVFESLVRMSDAGYTMCMVEQNAARALALASYGYVLEFGENRIEGPGPELLNNDKVLDLYLGGSEYRD